MEPVERIKRLTQYLSKGDIALVDSAIVKTKRNISSNNPDDKFDNYEKEYC